MAALCLTLFSSLSQKRVVLFWLVLEVAFKVFRVHVAFLVELVDIVSIEVHVVSSFEVQFRQ